MIFCDVGLGIGNAEFRAGRRGGGKGLRGKALIIVLYIWDQGLLMFATSVAYELKRDGRSGFIFNDEFGKKRLLSLRFVFSLDRTHLRPPFFYYLFLLAGEIRILPQPYRSGPRGHKQAAQPHPHTPTVVEYRD